MTRVNLVPPRELTDQHLFAEFRELKMVPRSLRRSIAAHGVDALLRRIPGAYTLGTGHVTFFYDKGRFLQERYGALRYELRRRRFNFDELALLDPESIYSFDARLLNRYTPTPEALALNRARIANRIAKRPDWYRFYGRPIQWHKPC